VDEASESFRIDVVEGIFALSGSCDFENWRHVRAWLSDARPNELDVGNVTSFDPFGARALIDAKLQNRRFRLINVNESVRVALDRLGLLDYLTAERKEPR
jgi:anti-anti-sigma regulatory factor